MNSKHSFLFSFSYLLFTLFLPLEVLAQSSEVSQKICPNELPEKINQITTNSVFTKTHWGILVQTLKESKILYQKDSNRHFIPASNVKLITTATALQRLGENWKIQTIIYQDKQETPDQINHLIVVGRGDPSLNKTQLTTIAKKLRNQGIRSINQLGGDDRYFRGNLVNDFWEWGDIQTGYGAPINSLIYDQNSIELILTPQNVGQPLQIQFAEPEKTSQWILDNYTFTVPENEEEFVYLKRDLFQPIVRVRGQLRVGSEPESLYFSITNPTRYFLENFRQILETEGITVKEIVVNPPSPSFTQEIARIESPPLRELIKETNENSNNLYAEVLLRLLATPQQIPVSEIEGLTELRNFLTQGGINPDEYRLVDGSGLSYRNLITPEAIIKLLKMMGNSSVYRNSLPVGGVSGTLKNRLQNTEFSGKIQAKTGTLTGVSALSGYLESPNFEPLVFSLMVNQSNLSPRQVRQGIDDIILLLSRLRHC